MEKIQMPCTEAQFNRDLKPFLVDAGIDIKCCQSFCTNPYIQTPYAGKYSVGCFIFERDYKTIDYNQKEFLKHLGIEIYDVGDVVNIGEYECEVNYHPNFRYYYLHNKLWNNYKTIEQFGLISSDIKNIVKGNFHDLYHATLYDLNKTIQFLKSHKMQEKPFTIEQAREMLAIESLKELAYQHYPELKSPVNTVNEELLSQLSYGMFGDEKMTVVAKASTRTINRPDLDGKAILVQNNLKPVLHDLPTGETIIEFKNK